MPVEDLQINAVMKKITFVFCGYIFSMMVSAQQKQAITDKEITTFETAKVFATFKSTKVILSHSVDMLRKSQLDVRILHRFGYVNKGIKELFGLDEASMHLGFNYGLTDNISLGIGRSTYRKELDGFIKWRILQQTSGQKTMPLSLVLVAGSTVWTEKSFATPKPSAADRFSYYLQVIAARKFSNKFSGQISQVFVHSNAPLNGEARNITAPGIGLKYKISRRTSLTLDYQHILKGLSSISHYPLGVGIDLETGGHIFQLHFSNATGMNERAFLYETYGRFFNGDIRFGFNLSRLFHIRKNSY